MIENDVRRGNGKRTMDEDEVSGIVIADMRRVVSVRRNGGDEDGVPRISAFIWGGKVKPSPILRFGRWKGAA